ncbi:uncharacterized protein LOC108029910 [Drosophila biarmipes]|uniref:uncharacterized protein LOC108029910 n=1 Tax=Drosophila biarmipes TaxID=125945 RepID=UPI0007E79789|nr:uncharacterized protein LOC108029910 [Drosophila biarmipes]
MLTSVFCMRLNTYGVVIGWLGVIFSFLATILLSVGLGFVDQIAQQIVDTQKNTEMTVSEVRTVLVILFSVYLALKVINLLASAMLVVGTVKERHLLLLPWLINNGVILAIAVITHIGLWAEIIGSSVPFLNALPVILLSVLVLVLGWYLYYGIYSLFKQIQASSEMQRPLIPSATQQTNSYPSYTKI